MVAELFAVLRFAAQKLGLALDAAAEDRLAQIA